MELKNKNNNKNKIVNGLSGTMETILGRIKTLKISIKTQKIPRALTLWPLIFVMLMLFVLISSQNASAIIIRGNPFLNLSRGSFGPSQILEGNLNFSLVNEPSNTIVRGIAQSIAQPLTKEMALIDFLEKSNAYFTCSNNCKKKYIVSGASLEKQTSFSKEKYYALKIGGRTGVVIKNMSFSLSGSSNANMTCGETPLKIDLLDDDTIDWEYKVPDDWCSDFYGSECFSMANANEDSVISETPYCEKIHLNKTGEVELSAYLKLVSDNEAEADLIMGIYDINGNLKGYCNITVYSTDYDFMNCIIDPYEQEDFYIQKQGDYFVCIKKTGGGDAVIKSESSAPLCGFYGQPPRDTFTTDYALYVREAGFAPFDESLEFNKDTFIASNNQNQNLISYLQNYVNTKYNGNCSSENGCVFSIKFILTQGSQGQSQGQDQQQSQSLNLSGLNFKFGSSTGDVINNNFYDLTIEWPKINMTFRNLPLSVLNLSAPAQPGNYILSAGVGTFLESKSFKVEPVPTIESLSPLIVTPGNSVEFKVFASAPSGHSIVKYKWDFGDGSQDETTEPKINHTYNSPGNYNLVVRAEDNYSLEGSRTFVITSTVTKEFLNETIKSLKARLNNLIPQYYALDSWYRNMTGINITSLNSSLNSLETQLNQSNTQSQLMDIKNQIDSLEIPASINDTLVLLESSYLVDPSKVDINYITDITGENYNLDKEEEYQNAVSGWQENNFDIKISGKVISLVHLKTIEDKFTVFTILLDPSTNFNANEFYLIFKLPPNVGYSDVRILSNASDISNLNDAIGFTYDNLENLETISLAIPGKHDFSELMFYVSPSLGELINTQTTKPEKKPYGLAIFLIILLVIILSIALWFIWHKGKAKKVERFGRLERPLVTSIGASRFREIRPLAERPLAKRPLPERPERISRISLQAKPSKRQSKLFANSHDLYNLVNFISTSKSAGIKKSEIVKKLKKAGWKTKQIEYAFKRVR